MNGIGWALLIIVYTAVCAIWSGLFTLGDKPPDRASPEAHRGWKQGADRRTKRIWIWQAGLALIMIVWWCDSYLRR